MALSLAPPRRSPAADPFERSLLRRGMGALEAERDRCAECGRTPLTGEHVHLYEGRGRGAGARFRVKIPCNRFSWADVTLVEVERPHRIVEVGRTGKNNRVRTLGVYELAPGAGGTTRVRFTLQTEPVMLSDRLLETLGGRSWGRRKGKRAMRRLRTILERDEGRG